MNLTPEQISKLPKWAQEHVNDLQRQRDIAVRRLDEMTDNQKPSPWKKTEHDGTSDKIDFRTVYYQADDRMTVEHAGVRLDILLARKDDNQRLYGIDLSFSAIDRGTGHHVAVCPRGAGSLQLVLPKYME